MIWFDEDDGSGKSDASSSGAPPGMMLTWSANCTLVVRSRDELVVMMLVYPGIVRDSPERPRFAPVPSFLKWSLNL